MKYGVNTVNYNNGTNSILVFDKNKDAENYLNFLQDLNRQANHLVHFDETELNINLQAYIDKSFICIEDVNIKNCKEVEKNVYMLVNTDGHVHPEYYNLKIINYGHSVYDF